MPDPKTLFQALGCYVLEKMQFVTKDWVIIVLRWPFYNLSGVTVAYFKSRSGDRLDYIFICI